jgi:hypothetical protein
MAVEEGEEAKQSIATLTEYLWSIIYMPSSLRYLIEMSVNVIIHNFISQIILSVLGSFNKSCQMTCWK